MKRIILAAVVLFTSGIAYASGGAHWSYSGDAGPEHWGKLSPEFSVCGTGKNQSPIDLTGFIEAKKAPIQIEYQAGGNEILNNGHTVQVNYASGSKLRTDGKEFDLKQFHFHAPSENLINGKSYAMEAHLVHADKDGNLAVIAVMFTEGKENAGLEKAWASMPEKEGVKHKLSSVSAEGILPPNRDYYRFNGSLTTPPCTEGVRWFVMKEPLTASHEQIEKFAHVMHHPNNRPVQPVNARPVLQ